VLTRSNALIRQPCQLLLCLCRRLQCSCNFSSYPVIRLNHESISSALQQPNSIKHLTVYLIFLLPELILCAMFSHRFFSFYLFFTLLLMLYLCMLYIFIFFFLYLIVNKVDYLGRLDASRQRRLFLC